ncbi:2-oxoglutarate dehydrogenase complex dehydrogenase (E1) component-like enzyme [Bradyrhizobium sp. F1.13.4]
MSRQDANAAFALSSFLQGTNATYIDEIYARYEKDPSSVDAEWQDFFKSLNDQPGDISKNAQGPSWERANWPLTPQDDLTSALDGNWAEVEKTVGAKIAAMAQAKGGDKAGGLSSADLLQATRDSVRALMLIRSYRMRGHFHAKLDPLGIEAQRNREELDPRTYGFSEADFDRKIFLDHVLGLEYASLREITAICERTYCQTLGVEFMHITNAAQKAWIQERIEGPDKEISFTREGRRAILMKLVEAEGFEKFCDTKFTGTKRFGPGRC